MDSRDPASYGRAPMNQRAPNGPIWLGLAQEKDIIVEQHERLEVVTKTGRDLPPGIVRRASGHRAAREFFFEAAHSHGCDNRTIE